MDNLHSPRCILLVDDNPDDRLLARRELAQEFPKVQLLEAGNANTFARMIGHQPIDMVITDYQLRWSNGLEILRTSKAIDQNLPVIMFTNSGTQETAVEAMKAGLDDYVIKAPKHLVRLRRAVAAAWENAQTRRRVAELEGRLQFLLNQLTIGVFRATVDGRLLEINDSLLRLLGLNGLRQAQAVFQQQALLDPLTAQRSNQEWTTRVCCPNGQSLWLQISATLSTEAQQAIVDGLVTDVTAQKQAADTIQQLNRTLERRIQKRTAQVEATNRELEDFAFSVSHDLRAPIRQISGFVGLLEDELAHGAQSETIRHYLNNIKAVTNDANRMILDLLEYSRSGQVEFEWTSVDMNQLVGSVQQQLMVEVCDRNTDPTQPRQIQWTLDPLPAVRGDRMLLRQVWQNLMDNAIKYTRPRRPSHIHIGSHEDGDEWVFWIKDNGIGFDMDQTDQLFSVFQRLKNQEDFEGTGIGLANVKRIILRHGGRVWATAAPDQGATFFFSLPKD